MEVWYRFGGFLESNKFKIIQQKISATVYISHDLENASFFAVLCQHLGPMFWLKEIVGILIRFRFSLT